VVSQLRVLPAREDVQDILFGHLPVFALPLEAKFCSSADRLFTQVVLRLKHQPTRVPEALQIRGRESQDVNAQVKVKRMTIYPVLYRVVAAQLKVTNGTIYKAE
jgi:hypothetical protein